MILNAFLKILEILSVLILINFILIKEVCSNFYFLTPILLYLYWFQFTALSFNHYYLPHYLLNLFYQSTLKSQGFLRTWVRGRNAQWMKSWVMNLTQSSFVTLEIKLCSWRQTLTLVSNICVTKYGFQSW